MQGMDDLEKRSRERMPGTVTEFEYILGRIEEKKPQLAALYKHISPLEQFVFINTVGDVNVDQLANIIQRNCCDAIIMRDFKKEVYVEEKIIPFMPERRNSDYVTAICVEEYSCTNAGNESLGWIRTCKSDYINYCYELSDGTLYCFFIYFPQLYKLFSDEYDNLNDYNAEGFNCHTKAKGKLIPFNLLTSRVHTKFFVVTPDFIVEEHTVKFPDKIKWR